MTDWNQLQKDVCSWATNNFGDTPAWMPMLGLVEEVGEYQAAVTCHNDPERIDAIGDQGIYVLNLCEKVGINFADLVGNDNPRQCVDSSEMLGILGVGAQSILKNAQGIRGFTWEKRRDRMLVCVSMWYRWAQWECWSLRTTFDDVVTKVWDVVKRRDWVKNPTNANIC